MATLPQTPFQRTFYTQKAQVSAGGTNNPSIGTLFDVKQIAGTESNQSQVSMNRSASIDFLSGKYWIRFTNKGVVTYMGKGGNIFHMTTQLKFVNGTGRTGGTGFNSLTEAQNSPQWFRAYNSNPVSMGW